MHHLPTTTTDPTHTSTHPTTAHGLLTVVLALVLVGCGTSSGGSPTTPQPTTDAAIDGGSGANDADAGGLPDAENAEDSGQTQADTAASSSGAGSSSGGINDTGSTATEDNDELCDDGKDNDGNGYTDCDDFSCSKNDKVSVCANKPKEDTDDLCDDGKDNDGNGYTDCDDFSCSKNDKVTVCGGGSCGDGKCNGGENEKTCPKDCAKSGPLSCKDKCGNYDENATCQCDEGCAEFDDCCDDYKQLCVGAPKGSTTCKDRCGDYDADAQCQCDEGCVDFDDCCVDYVKLCAGSTSTTDGGAAGVIITELMVRSQSGADDGEFIELYNPATAAVDLDGWELVYKDNVKLKLDKTKGKTLVAGQSYFIIGRSHDPAKNHGSTVDYAQTTIGLGNSGGKIALHNGTKTVDEVKYDKANVQLGVAWQLSADKLDATTNDDPKSWCLATVEYGNAKKLGSLAKANAICK